MLPHCAHDLRLHLVEPAELRIGASTTVQQVQDHPIGVDVLHPRTPAQLVGHPELAGVASAKVVYDWPGDGRGVEV